MFGPRHFHRLGLLLGQLRDLPRNARCLDAACGLGQLAGRIKAAGHRAFGVDGEIAAAMYTWRHERVPAVVADMARLPFRDATFDVVTSGETLEHLDDDRAGAAELSRVARAGGRCVVTVPALRALWTASDDYYEHRRRYTKRELVDLMAAAGFAIDRATYWGFPFTLLYDTLVVLPMNRRRARNASVAGMTNAGKSRLLVTLVRAVFAVDRIFQFIPFGPGLLLTATKR